MILQRGSERGAEWFVYYNDEEFEVCIVITHHVHSDGDGDAAYNGCCLETLEYSKSAAVDVLLLTPLNLLLLLSTFCMLFYTYFIRLHIKNK